MLILMLLAAGAAVIWVLRRMLPVHSLHDMEIIEWAETYGNCNNAKILDVRDASFFRSGIFLAPSTSKSDDFLLFGTRNWRRRTPS